MNSRFSLWIFMAGVLGALAIGLSAWGSHGLPLLIPDPDALQIAKERAQTANHFLLFHALALLGIGLWRQQGAGWLANIAAVCMLIGLASFCGGMYILYIFSDFSSSNTVYLLPFGGICLILGWLSLALSAWRK